MKKTLIAAAIAALAIPGLLACSRAQAAESATTSASNALHLDPSSPKLGFIKVAEVRAAIDAEVATATGKVAFNEDVTSRVGTPVSGRVAQLHVQVGDKVKKGQPLVTIASPDVEAARAEAIQAEADQQVAERALERAKRLFAESAIAQKELQGAEEDSVKARSNVERTKARLAMLGVTTKNFGSNFVLRAPIDGTVVERAILPGQEIRSDAGTPLITLADLRTLWVLADVYERDLARVRMGDAAEIRVAAYPGDVFKGKVLHVGEMVDSTTHTVKVRIAVPNPDGRLKPEMFAKVALVSQSATPVLSIPASALISDGETNQVIVADAAGNYRARTIDVGAEHEGQVRVLNGLQSGEKIVIEGALFVKSEIEQR